MSVEGLYDFSGNTLEDLRLMLVSTLITPGPVSLSDVEFVKALSNEIHARESHVTKEPA